MATVRELITSSLRVLTVVQKSEAPTADEMQDALEVLNDLLASWANDSLLVYSRTWEDFALVPGQLSYSIGTGGDFNTTRPTQIISAYITLAGSNISYPLMEITDDQYALEINQKNLSSNIPQFYNFDNQYPLAHIRIWQVPSTTSTFHMQSEKQVSNFASLDDIIILPPGWNRAIRYNLAVDLSPEYNMPITPVIAQIAQESKGILRSQALKNRPLTFIPDQIGSGYDVYGDVYK